MQSMAGQSNSATTLSSFIDELEISAFEISNDDIDDGIPSTDITHGVEKFRFSAGKITSLKFSAKRWANIIRGPPISLNH
ncbi:hypothetical protein KL866_04750 [Alteromonas sp. ALT199]|nr:hypothetical protein [Alteromonas sp. ALT199]